ncbi:hypothetical protein [uncultured Jannaschia sp.]|uniref:hypothetical protein n=1 Tax=uncultured Jannaschia sp. TaxID=293347 RepID=UPI00260FBF74|nr:hypothetical protein [uncultured Jannaschia sp.]
MTALHGIERLETTGLWRPDAGADRREVYVTLGEAELVLQDFGGTALSHWSLPALVRRNPREAPALYAPHEEAGEDLEIAEPEMIAALDRVVSAVEMGRRRPGALRRALVGLAVGVALGALAIWLPGALRRHAANIIPPAQARDIGDRMLDVLARRAGPACSSIPGNEALARLRQRLAPTRPLRLAVLRDLEVPALALPGDLIVLSNRILEARDDPDVAAGHLLAAILTTRTQAPLNGVLQDLGLGDLLRLLASGRVPDRAIAGHVSERAARPPALPPEERLRAGFDAAQLAWTPWAGATGRATTGAAPSDMPPSLEDTVWLALRDICR